MCSSSHVIIFGFKLFFFLSTVNFEPCCSVPFQSYQGALTWDWDHDSSGNGDPEEAITTLTDSTGSQSWIQISSERWGDHERPLSKDERGKICAYNPNCEKEPKGARCNYDRDCEKSQFCHEQYKYCDKRRYVGQKCRRTENCLRGAICMWGQCYKEKKPGLYRSRCKRHIDCASNLCCAREHGESICKPYLKEGQNCSVSSGGYVYSMQHDCSCGFGLVCKTVGWSKRKGWRPEPMMKCFKI